MLFTDLLDYVFTDREGFYVLFSYSFVFTRSMQFLFLAFLYKQHERTEFFAFYSLTVTFYQKYL